jgi:tetratricopeptide (TPR) repeat protein
MAPGCFWSSNKGTEANPDALSQAADAEAQAFAHELELAFQSKDRSRAMQVCALEVIAHRVANSLPLAEDKKADTVKFLQTKADAGEFVDELLDIIRDGGVFKLLRVQAIDERHHATFRLTHPKSSVIVYVDTIIARSAVGRVGVEDIIILNDGERLTDQIRYDILPAAALRDSSLESRLSDDEKLLVAHSDKVKKLLKARNNNKMREVVAAYKDLPLGLKNRKACLFIYVRAIESRDRAEQKRTMDTCRQLFPGDPALVLFCLDLHVARDEKREAIQEIEALRKIVGEDAYLDAAEAALLGKLGQYETARAAADRAIQREPDLLFAYISRISVAVDEKNYVDVLAWLKKTVEQTGHYFGDLRTLPAYSSFVRSPQHEEWLKWLAKGK